MIGGYLGSGKSTLVNRLLSGALPGRTAVVVNDFGSVNIDADLILSAEGGTIELSNGCICCQLSDDVSRTMRALAERRDLDNVICEVSGVGDPGELAAWRSYPGFAPGPVVVCADATAIVRLSHDQYVADTVRRQLGSAEFVLITKTDLAMPGNVAEALAACDSAAPQAFVVQQDPVDPRLTAAQLFASEVRPSAAAGSVVDDAHTDVHSTCTVAVPGPIDVDSLQRALSAQSERLVRAKGIVQDAAHRWHEVHLAAGRVEVSERVPGAPAPAAARLVLISAGADRIADLERARTELLDAVGIALVTMPGRENCPIGVPETHPLLGKRSADLPNLVNQ
ncbi:CobW family GTP-binding protein [Paeniglutamicibacter sp. NPDC012692]|uniref:CobW family GTP-binding protein n=1 Tax=Paeniglutamicibacter sp. NPDC012692 TaxID=3364388 RepID=UPI00368D30B9